MNRAAAALAILLGICLVAYSGDAQVTVNLSPVPRMQFFDASGAPLAGGCIFTYAAGTSTPQATYVDSGGVIQNTNPIILDSGGFATIWLAQLAYKFVVFSTGGVNCASGTQQWTVDKIQNLSNLTIPNTWSALQTFSGGVSIPLPMTLTQNGFSNTLTAAVTAARTWTLPDAGGPIAITNIVQTWGATQNFSSGGILLDSITGTLTNGGLFSLQTQGGIAANGESFTLTTGNGAATFSGGNINFTAGNGTTSGSGGAVTIRAGNGGTSGAGSSTQIFAGNGNGAGTSGGNILLASGTPGAGGAAGLIQLQGSPESTGTVAILSGTGACATLTTQTGGSWAGSAKCTGATAASTLTITFAAAAANGYNCTVQDETTRANIFQQTSHTPNTCVLTITSVTQNDIFTFSAIAF